MRAKSASTRCATTRPCLAWALLAACSSSVATPVRIEGVEVLGDVHETRFTLELRGTGFSALTRVDIDLGTGATVVTPSALSVGIVDAFGETVSEAPTSSTALVQCGTRACIHADFSLEHPLAAGQYGLRLRADGVEVAKRDDAFIVSFARDGGVDDAWTTDANAGTSDGAASDAGDPQAD